MKVALPFCHRITAYTIDTKKLRDILGFEHVLKLGMTTNASF